MAEISFVPGQRVLFTRGTVVSRPAKIVSVLAECGDPDRYLIDISLGVGSVKTYARETELAATNPRSWEFV